MKSKIQAIDMKYLRKVKGITRRDRIKNDVVRDKLGAKHIIKFVEKQKLKWFGHTCSMKNNRQVKQIWEAGIQKSKAKGRPRKTWNDEISKVLQEKGKTWTEAKTLAKNKKE
ncbi:hypothetical protein RN001_013820 [Aquatica leii]|uniref:Endonuclease-reverse transcriptase n=1 Tax=Aquatica leii TaxID=1421715 RepID=A0AAN7Q064_9COLE|nr:hypothetical protein RN001_013820 [Aquatica leii]